MIKNIKLYVATIITISLILFSWKLFYSLSCFSFLFPIVILGIVSSSFIDTKMNKRRCFKNCYFQNNSIFSKILISSMGVVVFYSIFSIAFTLSIMYGVISFPYQLWLYLLIHIALVILIYKKIIKSLGGTVQDEYLNIFSREWAINITSIILFVIYAYIFYNGYEPEYLVKDLVQTINNASNSISSSCLLIDYLLRFKTELDGTFWWIVSNSSETLKSEVLKTAIWVIFIFINSLAILGINRIIVQIVYLLDKTFSRKGIE